MELNGEKFEILVNKSLLLRNLPSTSTHLQYHLPHGTMIEQSKNVRDLGVLLSNDCSWSPYVHQMLAFARKVADWVFSVF